GALCHSSPSRRLRHRAGAASAGWSAQSGPSANIRLLLPRPPAGSTDVMARLIQNSLQQRLGATIIIENKAGASGSVGSAIVAKSPPDRNTRLLGFDNHRAHPFLLGKPPYHTEKDFDPRLFVRT